MLQSEMCPNLADICLLLFSRTYGTYSGVVSALVSARIWFHPVWRGHLRSGKCLFYVLIVTLHTSTKFSQTINSEVITYLLILYLCYHSCKRVHCTPCNHSGSQAHKHSQHSLFQSPERDLAVHNIYVLHEHAESCHIFNCISTTSRASSASKTLYLSVLMNFVK